MSPARVSPLERTRHRTLWLALLSVLGAGILVYAAWEMPSSPGTLGRIVLVGSGAAGAALIVVLIEAQRNWREGAPGAHGTPRTRAGQWLFGGAIGAGPILVEALPWPFGVGFLAFTGGMLVACGPALHVLYTRSSTGLDARSGANGDL